MKQVSCCDVLSETILLTDHAANYANSLLAGFGCDERVETAMDHPALAWKRSGLLHTTKLMLPSPLVSHVDGALLALKALSRNAELPGNGSMLLGERARLRDTVRRGRQCAGGYGRLMDTRDGRIALNLVRADDWDLIPAWLEDYADDWDGITRIVAQRQTKELVERAAEIGLAVAEDTLPNRLETWFTIQRFEKAPPAETPLIVDLSSLWAGPLASSLLGMTEAQIIKVESPNRPDGMRLGHDGFYKLLNAGKNCVALNFRDMDDLDKLKALLAKVDIVIEASRPRALQQLGIIAEDFVAQKPGQIWARITAYGQTENRIGFGDDIGISAGLATLMKQAHDEPCFVGDAIADPVTGLHLAFALRVLLAQGGGAVLDLSMREVLRYAIGDLPNDLTATMRDWQSIADQDNAPLYEMRQVNDNIRSVGADNAKWL